MTTYTACNCTGNCWIYGGCVAQRKPIPDGYYIVTTPLPSYGWICPVCQKVNAPSVLECNHEKEESESAVEGG